MKLKLKITKSQARAVLNAVPKGSSITISGRDALKILGSEKIGKK